MSDHCSIHKKLGVNKSSCDPNFARNLRKSFFYTENHSGYHSGYTLSHTLMTAQISGEILKAGSRADSGNSWRQNLPLCSPKWGPLACWHDRQNSLFQFRTEWYRLLISFLWFECSDASVCCPNLWLGGRVRRSFWTESNSSTNWRLTVRLRSIQVSRQRSFCGPGLDKILVPRIRCFCLWQGYFATPSEGCRGGDKKPWAGEGEEPPGPYGGTSVIFFKKTLSGTRGKDDVLYVLWG